jgi:hypothetical protein
MFSLTVSDSFKRVQCTVNVEMMSYNIRFFQKVRLFGATEATDSKLTMQQAKQHTKGQKFISS